MEDCELCGTSAKSVYVVNVEDVELRVCAKCAKGKKVISTYSDAPLAPSRPSMTTKPKREEDQTVIENYGTIIRKARERMNLPIGVLAEMLSEKETLLARIEQQSTLPTIALTKKLEKALSIKLIATESESDTGSAASSKAGGATLGEFINRK
jgi:putative transcription factor